MMKKGKFLYPLFGLIIIASVFIAAGTVGNLDMTSSGDVPDSSTPEFDFKYTGVVDLGTEVMPLVGQLSKDGKTMYFTSQNMRGVKQLYRMTRKQKGLAFSTPERLKGSINSEEYDIIMPTMSADEKTLVFVNSVDGTQKGNDLFIATWSDDANSYTNIRSLDELNNLGKSDSYPYLSADAKSLYFTKQKGANITFHVARRTATDQQFDTPKALNITIPKVSNNMSCMVSNDEKSIFILSGDKIYFAERENKFGEFNTPVEIAQSNNDGYISGITLTDDQAELFVYNSIGFRNTQILRFANSAVEEVIDPTNITIPEKQDIDIR